MNFQNMKINPYIKKVITETYGFHKATEIQRRAIPLILDNKNVIGLAPSGTGKTLAYLIPLIEKIITTPVDHDLPLGMILAPTTELADQIYSIAVDLGKPVDLAVANISGRLPFKPSRMKENRIDLIVATPGKLLETKRDGNVDISRLKWLVLDECDMLLDMGFMEDILSIIKSVHPDEKLRIHMFSATLPPEVEKIANFLAGKPNLVEIRRLGLPRGLKQYSYEMLREEKKDFLVNLLKTKKDEIESAMIFVHSKEGARSIAKFLMKEGFDVEELHGGLTKRQRLTALENFRLGEVNIMVATEVGSRGIDIPELSHVINFDIPRNVDEYVHRVGRTARAGATGVAFNLVSPEELHLVTKIERATKSKVQVIQKLPETLRRTERDIQIEKKKEEKRKQRMDKRINKGWFDDNYQRYDPNSRKGRELSKNERHKNKVFAQSRRLAKSNHRRVRRRRNKI